MTPAEKKIPLSSIITKTHLWVAAGVLSAILGIATYAEAKMHTVIADTIERSDSKYVSKDAFHVMSIQLKEAVTMLCTTRETLQEVRKQLDSIYIRLSSIDKSISSLETKSR